MARSCGGWLMSGELGGGRFLILSLLAATPMSHAYISRTQPAGECYSDSGGWQGD